MSETPCEYASKGRLSVQVPRFLVTGVLNTAVGLSIIFGMKFGLGSSVVTANAVGYGAGLLLSFFLNRSWSFSSTASIRRSLPLFMLVVAVAFALNILVITGASALGAPYVLAQLAGVVVYSSLVFVGSRHVVFVHQT